MRRILAKLFGQGSPTSAVAVVKLDDQLFALLDGGACERISYLLMGGYGNYLIGMPRDPAAFDKFITSKGGIKHSIPISLESSQQPQYQFIFQRYGAPILYLPSLEDEWQLPVADFRSSFLGDLGLKLLVAASLPVWELRGRGYRYLSWAGAGLTPSGLALVQPQDQKSKLPSWADYQGACSWLPGWKNSPNPDWQLLNSWETSSIEKLPSPPEQWPYDGNAAAAPVHAAADQEVDQQWEALVDLFEENSCAFFAHRQAGALCFYDDWEFDYQDREIITRAVREQLHPLLEQAGWQRQKAQLYSHPQLQTTLWITPPLRDAASELYTWQNLAPPTSWMVITPTQMALLLHSRDPGDQSGELMKLSKQLPFNLKKLSRHLGNDLPQALHVALYAQQKDCAAYFRRRRPKGMLGYARKAD